MEAFLTRFYDDVDEHLGDPHASARISKASKLRKLHDADEQIFNQLLKTTMQESLLGYAEATITLEDGKEFYPLPPGFRQLVQFEFRWTERSTSILRSKQFYETHYGIDILSGSRGMRLRPPPSLSAPQDWVLLYLRSPGFLHHATAFKVGDKSVTSGVPGTDAGELILTTDYYNGMELRVFSAGRGAPQTQTITGFSILGDKGTFHLRHAFTPVPSGVVLYEICPTLPLKYDSIYALDVALLILGDRDRPVKVASLLKQRQAMWVSCKQYFESNVTDRGPARIHPLSRADRIATGEIPVW